MTSDTNQDHHVSGESPEQNIDAYPKELAEGSVAANAGTESHTSNANITNVDIQKRNSIMNGTAVTLEAIVMSLNLAIPDYCEDVVMYLRICIDKLRAKMNG